MPKFENSYIIIADEYAPSVKVRFPMETIFASDPVRVFSPSSEDVNLAKAGIDSLKPFLDKSIDLEKNYDLIGVAFNAFVVNRVNKNDQVISTEVALSAVENFKFKPMNIEHKRKNVVGLITNYGFSEFGTDKPLTLEEVKDKKDPFNVVLSGFVWRVVDDLFANKLEESSDPSSEDYLAISTSWEMGFKDFSIAKGSKNLSEAVVISEPSEVEKLKNSLFHFGGKGSDEEGQKIYLNLTGEVLPLGIGFTERPAADVKGVKVAGSDDLIDKNELNELKIESSSSHIEEKDVKSIIYLEDSEDHEQIAASKRAENKENINNENTEKNMIIKSIKDLTEDSLKNVSASDVKALFEEEIKKASEKFLEEKKQKEDAIAEIEQAKTALEQKLSEVSELSSKLQSELDAIKEQAAAKEKEESFQNRMTTLDEEFELTAEEREVVGSQIKDLDEEGFEKWYNAFNVFAKGKNKKFMAEMKEKAEKEASEKEAKSSTEKEVEEVIEASEKENLEKEAVEVLEKAEANESALPNNGASSSETLREKFAKAFNSETIKVKAS